MLTSTAPTARTRRRLTGAVGAGLLVASTVGVAALTQSTASAAIRGNIAVSPTSGNDETLFGGSVTTDCPADTAASAFTVEGPNIEPFTAQLNDGPANGDGFQQFSGASIANIKSTSAGSFTTTSVYRITFYCQSGTGAITDTYEANLNYTVGAAGALGTFTITPAVVVQPSPTTPVSPSPTTPVSPSPTTPVSPSPTTPVSPSPTTSASPTTTVSPSSSVSPSTSPGPGTGVGSGNAGTGGTGGTGTGGAGSGTTGTGTGTGSGSGTGSTSGSLPRTGEATGALLALSLALISGGGALIVAGRRKNWFSFGAHQA